MNPTTPKYGTRRRPADRSERLAAGWIAAGAAASIGLSIPVSASDSGLYVGASAVRTFDTLGRGALDSAVSAAVATASGSTLAIASSSTRLDDATWSANIGYRSSFFGVEASYLDLGHLKYALTGTETSPLGSSSLTTLALVGFLPLLDALEASVRAGAYAGKTTTDYSNLIDMTVHSGSASKTSTSLLLGAGLAYAVTGHLAVRLDYIHLDGLHEAFLGQSFNVDLATVGVTLAF